MQIKYRFNADSVQIPGSSPDYFPRIRITPDYSRLLTTIPHYSGLLPTTPGSSRHIPDSPCNPEYSPQPPSTALNRPHIDILHEFLPEFLQLLPVVLQEFLYETLI